MAQALCSPQLYRNEFFLLHSCAWPVDYSSRTVCLWWRILGLGRHMPDMPADIRQTAHVASLADCPIQPGPVIITCIQNPYRSSHDPRHVASNTHNPSCQGQASAKWLHGGPTTYVQSGMPFLPPTRHFPRSIIIPLKILPSAPRPVSLCN